MASTSALSSLYTVSRDRWGFSVRMLTVVFAVYVAVLPSAILAAGSLGDRPGSRSVLPAGVLLLRAVSMTALWIADRADGGKVRPRRSERDGDEQRAGRTVGFSSSARPGARVTAIATGGMALGACAVGLVAD